MQENLQLFETNPPETFEEALPVVFRVYDEVKDGVYLELDQRMNEFIQMLVVLFEADQLSDGDILFLIKLIDSIQTAEVEINSELLDKHAVKVTLPLISILAWGGQTDMEIELEPRVTSN